MVRIGIVGMGFMGKAHFGVYAGMPARAKVVAIADVDPGKRAGDWTAIRGNLDAGGAAADLSGVAMHADYRALLADPGIDVVDVTLPTHLHAEATLAALAAGKHVFCEKPMARRSADAYAMADAARRADRRLFVGQCIRFWPAYAHAAGAIRDGRYGAVRSACFRRFSPRPRWSWENWLMDNAKSGLAALDLHIHDADFVAHAFGPPRAVASRGLAGGGGFHHLHTTYLYDDARFVAAEGAWEYAPAYPFQMVFAIQFAAGTLALGADGALTYAPEGGGAEALAVPAGSGYDHEIAHFLDGVESGRASGVIPPESAAYSVALVEAEIESARTGRTVEVDAGRPGTNG